MRTPAFAALILLSTGCAAAFPTPIVPTGLVPVAPANAAAWASATVPAAWVLRTFSWRARANDESHGGHGSVYLYPPDSILITTRAALVGIVGEAAVVGDSTLWAEPKDQVQHLAPSYELLWAMVGIARPPRRGWQTEIRQDARTGVTMVRYVHGADTVSYVSVLAGRPRLETMVVEDGKRLGQVTAQFDQLRRVTRARLTGLSAPLLLDITFDSLGTFKQVPLPRELWNAPRDH